MFGVRLPRAALRPYVNFADFDSTQAKLLHGSDVKVIVSAMAIIAYVGALGLLIALVVLDFESKTALVGFISFLSVGGILTVLSMTLKYSKFIYFNRELQCITCPSSFFTTNKITSDWADWAASIQLGGTYSGATLHRLWLNHIPSGGGWELMSTSAGVDNLLGLWAFIVQFMDKDGPYPNVPELADQKNLTNGIGTWEEWKIRTRQPGFVDPYFVWKMELEKNPDLAKQ